MPPSVPASGPASSRSLQICPHPASGLTAPQGSLCNSPRSPEVLPQLTSAPRTALPPGLVAWVLAQSPAAEPTVDLDVRQACLCTLPQAGWPHSPPRCASRGGACLRGAQPRGPSPSPSQFPCNTAALRVSGASPAQRAARGWGVGGGIGECRGGGAGCAENSRPSKTFCCSHFPSCPPWCWQSAAQSLVPYGG